VIERVFLPKALPKLPGLFETVFFGAVVRVCNGVR